MSFTRFHLFTTKTKRSQEENGRAPDLRASTPKHAPHLDPAKKSLDSVVKSPSREAANITPVLGLVSLMESLATADFRFPPPAALDVLPGRLIRTERLGAVERRFSENPAVISTRCSSCCWHPVIAESAGKGRIMVWHTKRTCRLPRGHTTVQWCQWMSSHIYKISSLSAEVLWSGRLHQSPVHGNHCSVPMLH